LNSEFIPAIDFCEAIIDGTHDSPKQVEDGRKLVTSKNIVGGKLDLENCYNISEADFEQINRRSKVYEWDLLMSMIGTVGEICLLKEEPDYAIKNVGVFRARNESDAKWLYYYLASPSAQFDIYSRLRGSTQQFLPLGELRNFPILKPENEEIKSKIINQLFSIDCLIGYNWKLNQKISKIISALFRSWFIDFDPVKAKMEGKLPYGMDEEIGVLFPDSFEESRFELIPAGWKWGYLGDCVSVVGGGTPSTKNEDFWGGEYNWTSPKDLSNSTSIIMLDTERTITEAGLAKIPSGLLPINTVLMSSRAPIGYLALTKIPIAINQGYIAIPPDNGMSPNFILSWIHYNMPLIEAYSSGATFPEISKKEFRRLPILIPPIELIEKFNMETKHLYDSIEISTKQINSLKETRDVILPRLMSGELKVN
jgi:type I restriction enzyme, S subunit